MQREKENQIWTARVDGGRVEDVVKAIVLGAAVVILFAVALSGGSVMTQQAAPRADAAPPIDAKQPGKFETATFALG